MFLEKSFYNNFAKIFNKYDYFQIYAKLKKDSFLIFGKFNDKKKEGVPLFSFRPNAFSGKEKISGKMKFQEKFVALNNQYSFISDYDYFCSFVAVTSNPRFLLFLSKLFDTISSETKSDSNIQQILYNHLGSIKTLSMIFIIGGGTKMINKKINKNNPFSNQIEFYLSGEKNIKYFKEASSIINTILKFKNLDNLFLLPDFREVSKNFTQTLNIPSNKISNDLVKIRDYFNNIIKYYKSVDINFTLYNCSINRRYDMNLKTFLMSNNLDDNNMKSLLFEIFRGLYVFYRYFNFIHNDLHLGNILISTFPNSEKCSINIGIKSFSLYSRYLIQIIDFSFAEKLFLDNRMHKEKLTSELINLIDYLLFKKNRELFQELYLLIVKDNKIMTEMNINEYLDILFSDIFSFCTEK